MLAWPRASLLSKYLTDWSRLKQGWLSTTEQTTRPKNATR